MIRIQVLLYLLNYSFDKSWISEIRDLSLAEWKEVVWIAKKHLVAPMLYHRLKELDLSVPEEVLSDLKKNLLNTAYRNVRIYQILTKILSDFNQNSIPIVVLKGVYLAEAIYPNIGLRSMVDIDLLAKKHDILKAEEVLLSLGYKLISKDPQINQLGHHFCYSADRSPLIEIHWALYEDYSNNINMQDLWKRAQPVTLSGCFAYTLAVEDQILFLCLHMAHHVRDLYLQMIVDIGELVSKYEKTISWEDLKIRAYEWGIYRAVFVFLSLSMELLGIAIPDNVLSCLKPKDSEEKYHIYLRNQFLLKSRTNTSVKKTVQGKKNKAMSAGKTFQLMLQGIHLTIENISLLFKVPKNSWKIWFYFPTYYKRVLSGNIKWYKKKILVNEQMQDMLEAKYMAIAVKNWLLSGRISSNES